MVTIIKIGGNIIDAPEKLTGFLEDFGAVEGDKILVHGGGKVATEIGIKLGITANYVDGRRITDAATLELVTMVYGGLINKKIVAQLHALGSNAIGLTGADGNIIHADKRPVKEVDYGYVGDVTETGVNGALLHQLLQTGMTPVIAPLTHDGKGNMLNTNADTIARELAKALVKFTAVKLVYCFERDGVLNKDESVIPSITEEDLDILIAEGVVSAGMIPKLQNATSAVKAGVTEVMIGNAKYLQALIAGKSGTLIK